MPEKIKEVKSDHPPQEEPSFSKSSGRTKRAGIHLLLNIN